MKRVCLAGGLGSRLLDGRVRIGMAVIADRHHGPRPVMTAGDISVEVPIYEGICA